ILQESVRIVCKPLQFVAIEPKFAKIREWARMTPLHRSKRGQIMRASISSTVSRLAGAVAALWLCGAGSVWAGSGGGADLGTLNSALLTLCNTTLPMFGVTPPSCPQV